MIVFATNNYSSTLKYSIQFPLEIQAALVFVVVAVDNDDNDLLAVDDSYIDLLAGV